MGNLFRSLLLAAWILTVSAVLYGFYTGRLYFLFQTIAVYHENNPLGPPLPPASPGL